MGKTARNGKFILKRGSSGLGLFAEVPFKKGDFVIEYTGKLLSTKEADERNSSYLFEINSRWTIDGGARSNLSRYINHSCRPNCEIEIKKKRIFIYALKKIEPGEEITYDYGDDYFNDHIKPFGCKCDHCKKKRSRAKVKK